MWMDDMAKNDRDIKLMLWNNKACATDGRGLVAVDDPNCKFSETQLPVDVVWALKGKLPHCHAVPLDALLDWAEGYQPDDGLCYECREHGGKRKCDSCGGKKKDVCVCGVCGNKHQSKCPDCENGYVECEHDDKESESDRVMLSERGSLFGVHVNRYLVAKWLKNFRGCDEIVDVRTGKPEDVIVISGTGWDVFIMPTKMNEGMTIHSYRSIREDGQ